jgi:hypothetical protein
MFDSVVCDYPLPDPRDQKVLFQTKDLECLMGEYRIAPDGRLYKTAELARGRLARPRPRAFHGDITIYGSVERKRGRPRWVEYRVRFTRGRVEWIRSEGPTGHLSKRSPRTKPQWTDHDGGPLVPNSYGRPLTADEFAIHAPEKLELVDGRIRGDEQLLLLILTSLGLRRSVDLLGRERWQLAVDAASS